MLEETVRGKDLFILVDVCNHSLTYNMNGYTNHMSPDDHYQDLKRIIGATNGKAHRVSVIMPFLYEGRQHRRNGRESLDCAYAFKELTHDPRIQNAAPLSGFDNFTAHYQFIRALLRAEKDLVLDKDHIIVISPDEGALDRAIYFSTVIGADTGMFYKTVLSRGRYEQVPRFHHRLLKPRPVHRAGDDTHGEDPAHHRALSRWQRNL